MNKKYRLILLALLVVTLFSGCNIRTVEDMYCLPKRSQAYQALQSEIDKALGGQEYLAPLSGENRQTVQSADLDGDGVSEYLVFARGGADNPLKICIFAGDKKGYRLVDTIESTGNAFEQVEYVQMDGQKGLEIVVGNQVSSDVVRNVSVYTMKNGEIQQLLSTNYSKFVCCDLDTNGNSDLLVLRPGETTGDKGLAQLYTFQGEVDRTAEINMSGPSDTIKRIMVGKLNDQVPAVYVASSADAASVVTDIYAKVDGTFTNVALSNSSGTSVQTLRNYYVFSDDIDNDGVLELPDLITMKMPDQLHTTADHYLIRWYAMNSMGAKIKKQYTYHNFVGGWYVRLDQGIAPRMYVLQQGNSYEFYIWDEKQESSEKLISIYVLTGQKREEQAAIDNRFVLHRTETTVYAASLEVSSANYNITKDNFIGSFHMITLDWKTGET